MREVGDSLEGMIKLTADYPSNHLGCRYYAGFPNCRSSDQCVVAVIAYCFPGCRCFPVLFRTIPPFCLSHFCLIPKFDQACILLSLQFPQLPLAHCHVMFRSMYCCCHYLPLVQDLLGRVLLHSGLFLVLLDGENSRSEICVLLLAVVTASPVACFVAVMA